MIRIGTAGWNIPRAHQARFPSDGSQLARYGARLNAAEINTSFYRAHAPAIYARWAEAVPPDFRFAVKIPKAISHERGLARCREPLDKFLSEIAALAVKLGPLLLQLPPSFVFDARRTGRFLELLRARHGTNRGSRSQIESGRRHGMVHLRQYRVGFSGRQRARFARPRRRGSRRIATVEDGEPRRATDKHG